PGDPGPAGSPVDPGGGVVDGPVAQAAVNTNDDAASVRKRSIVVTSLAAMQATSAADPIAFITSDELVSCTNGPRDCAPRSSHREI
ncbi:MAG TPA: hypothetical protein VK607_16575, partial [Kofleriaceae bacterium]|nr:hypothetical protein [Kofleriaceae bacterium]